MCDIIGEQLHSFLYKVHRNDNSLSTVSWWLRHLLQKKCCIPVTVKLKFVRHTIVNGVVASAGVHEFQAAGAPGDYLFYGGA
jgi:hypothetical protein